MYVLLFFFFKQKTAYEMRISDWSSDVCSSDLTDRRGGAASHFLGGGRHLVHRRGDQLDLTALPGNGLVALGRHRLHLAGLALDLGNGVADLFEIGRASCRERVCQYV